MRNRHHKSHAEQPKQKTNVQLIQHRVGSLRTIQKPKQMQSIFLMFIRSHKFKGKEEAPVF